MSTCVYCGKDVAPANDPGVGPADHTLVDSGGSAFCPDPAALDGHGVLVGQRPTHAVREPW